MEDYITLEQMLRFREEKAKVQENLRKRHAGGIVAALGMNIPGPQKTSPGILLAFEEGMRTLDELFADNSLDVSEEILIKEKAGYLKICALECSDAIFVKRMTVRAEETHPLGRLFDIDVYDAKGVGISRELLGAPVRKCLLCGQDAKICGRSRSHEIGELYQCVENMIQQWQNGKSKADKEKLWAHSF